MVSDPYSAMFSSAMGAASGGPSSAASDTGEIFGETSAGSVSYGGVTIGGRGIDLNSPWVWGGGILAALLVIKALK